MPRSTGTTLVLNQKGKAGKQADEQHEKQNDDGNFKKHGGSPMAKFTFKADWKSTLLLLLVIPLFLSLGTWQLQRADEKKVIATTYAARLNMSAITLDQLSEYEDKTNIPVGIVGRYTGEHYLLENQWRNKKLGVEVLSIFETEEGLSILLNRGWLENADRRQTPAFDTPMTQQVIQTTVYQPSKAPYTLGELQLENEVWPKRLTYLAIDKIAQDIERPVYPLSLRINAAKEGLFDTNWPVINVKPETHIGYAVQWYLFAVVAFLVYLFANSNLANLIRNKD
jgi:surfeit locus 1 family protein